MLIALVWPTVPTDYTSDQRPAGLLWNHEPEAAEATAAEFLSQVSKAVWGYFVLHGELERDLFLINKAWHPASHSVIVIVDLLGKEFDEI